MLERRVACVSTAVCKGLGERAGKKCQMEGTGGWERRREPGSNMKKVSKITKGNSKPLNVIIMFNLGEGKNIRTFELG